MIVFLKFIFGAGLLSWVSGFLNSTPASGSLSPVRQGESVGHYINPQDQDILARTLWGEARNEGFQGMQAVANVIINRKKSRRWPNSVRSVCLQKKQFSAWNKNDPNRVKMLAVTDSDSRYKMALEISTRALLESLPDITGGADHYLNIPATRQMRGGSLPDWVDLNKKTADIGLHTFLRLA